MLGPAWTRREIERPQGEVTKGTYTASMYTAEQQQRLGVDAHGNPDKNPEKPDPEKPELHALCADLERVAFEKGISDEKVKRCQTGILFVIHVPRV